MKRTVALVAVIVALPLLWLAGEQHRTTCVNAGDVGCSVLPWSGHHENAVDRILRENGIKP